MGISYRVMFRRDPVPTALASVGLQHVHGAVYISGSSLRPGVQVRVRIQGLARAACGDLMQAVGFALMHGHRGCPVHIMRENLPIPLWSAS